MDPYRSPRPELELAALVEKRQKVGGLATLIEKELALTKKRLELRAAHPQTARDEISSALRGQYAQLMLFQDRLVQSNKMLSSSIQDVSRLLPGVEPQLQPTPRGRAATPSHARAGGYATERGGLRSVDSLHREPSPRGRRAVTPTPVRPAHYWSEFAMPRPATSVRGYGYAPVGGPPSPRREGGPTPRGLERGSGSLRGYGGTETPAPRPRSRSAGPAAPEPSPRDRRPPPPIPRTPSHPRTPAYPSAPARPRGPVRAPPPLRKWAHPLYRAGPGAALEGREAAPLAYLTPHARPPGLATPAHPPSGPRRTDYRRPQRFH